MGNLIFLIIIKLKYKSRKIILQKHKSSRNSTWLNSIFKNELNDLIILIFSSKLFRIKTK